MNAEEKKYLLVSKLISEDGKASIQKPVLWLKLSATGINKTNRKKEIKKERRDS